MDDFDGGSMDGDANPSIGGDSNFAEDFVRAVHMFMG